MSNKSLIKILTYAGIIPFIFAIVIMLKVGSGPEVQKIVSAYTSIIIAFISGIQFAYGLRTQKLFASVIILSNVISLVGWLAIVVEEISHTAILQILCLLILLFADWHLYHNKIVDKWFMKLRVKVSAIVILCLVIIYIM